MVQGVGCRVGVQGSHLLLLHSDRLLNGGGRLQMEGEVGKRGWKERLEQGKNKHWKEVSARGGYRGASLIRSRPPPPRTTTGP